MNHQTSQRRLRANLIRCSLAAAGLSAVASPSRAVDRFWGNAAGGLFHNGPNWTAGIVPVSTDIARFGLTTIPSSPQIYSVDFLAAPNPTTNLAIKIEDDLVTFGTMGGRTYRTTAATGNEIGNVAGRTGQLAIISGTFSTAISADLAIGAVATSRGRLVFIGGAQFLGPAFLRVGALGAGSLTVESSSFAATDTTFVGDGAGATGTIIVSGAGSGMRVDDLLVGNAGSGTIIVTGGGTYETTGVIPTLANQTNSSGWVDITGPGSRMINPGQLTVGENGSATMNVLAGGLVQNTAAFTTIIADNSPSTATVTVDGTNSRLTNSSGLTVGRAGNGTLIVTGGGTVQNTVGIVADSVVTASATVDGPGSQWVNSGALTVGNAGIGVLTITDGGMVQSSGGVVGAIANGRGTVIVDGPGSRWVNSGNLTIHDALSSGGTLTIRNGGVVQTNAGIIGVGSVGVSMTGFAVATVDGPGSQWINTSLTIGSTGGRGELDIRNGGSVTTSSVASIGVASGSDGVVTVEGSGAIWTVDNTIQMGFPQAKGTLNINTGGTVNVDLLSINGNGTVNINGGVLNVRGLGFNPFNPTGLVDFNAGTVRFTGATASPDSFLLDKVLGPEHTVAPLQHLAFANVASLVTSVIVDGGTFSASQLVNPSLLFLRRGTLELTNQAVTIEPGGLFGSALDLPADSTINVTLGITNRGLVRGDGQIGGAFVNDTAGELRAEPAKNLTFTGAATNNGRINLIGGVLEFGGGLTNGASGVISGNGTVIATTLNNAGSTSFSGQANIVGNVNNSAGGKILCTGGGPTTFFNDVVNNGEIRTSLASITVFLGEVTGAGSFSGPGTRLFESGSSGSFAALSAPGSTIISTGASVVADTIRQSSLTIEGTAQLRPSSGASRVDTLSIPAGGVFDLTNNSLIVDYTGLSPLNEIRALITSGFANGSWNGDGIQSSIAAITPNRAIGYAEATDLGSPATFAGDAIDPTCVLVRFTLPGDADLDRSVNIGDFALLASSFNQPSRWSRGDFNYDSVTDIGDFALLAANFNQALPAALPRAAAVPEPSSLLLGVVLAWTHRSGARRRP